VLTRRDPYSDLGSDYFQRRQRHRLERHLVKWLQALGNDVTSGASNGRRCLTQKVQIAHVFLSEQALAGSVFLPHFRGHQPDLSTSE
jgi:hypothetical protein